MRLSEKYTFPDIAAALSILLVVRERLKYKAKVTQGQSIGTVLSTQDLMNEFRPLQIFKKRSYTH
jgi:hypothetical protein